MLPDRAAAARLAQAVSVATFLAAAASMLIAGALQSAGRAGLSSALATLGYALGVAGVVTGVLALALEPDREQPHEDQRHRPHPQLRAHARRLPRVPAPPDAPGRRDHRGRQRLQRRHRRLAARLADVFADRGPSAAPSATTAPQLATGEIVLFIDSDMVLEPTVLADIAAVFDAPARASAR